MILEYTWKDDEGNQMVKVVPRVVFCELTDDLIAYQYIEPNGKVLKEELKIDNLESYSLRK